MALSFCESNNLQPVVNDNTGNNNNNNNNQRFNVCLIRASTGQTVPQEGCWSKILRRMPFLMQPQFLAGSWLPYYHINPGYMGELCVRRDVQLPEWRTRQPPHTWVLVNKCKLTVD